MNGTAVFMALCAWTYFYSVDFDIFTELAPRPIQSSSQNVHMCVCLFFPYPLKYY